MTDPGRIYLDHSATSFPKPPEVIAAVARQLENCGNPGRGGHHFSLVAARQLFQDRQVIASFLGIGSAERLIFTPGCTASINMVLKGLAASGYLRAGDAVLTTSMEHNAVMRPLAQLERHYEITHEQLPRSKRRLLDLDSLKRRLSRKDQPPVKLCLFTHASNVTGEVLDLEQAAATVQAAGVPLALDAAQSAGKLPTGIDTGQLAFWCSSGHKGLMGPPGVGLLYIDERFADKLEPLISGGTGSNSAKSEMPLAYPDHLEAGTPAGPAIAGLAAGVEWLRNEGNPLGEEMKLKDLFLQWAESRPELQIYGQGTDTNGTTTESGQRSLTLPVVSFRIKGQSPAETGDVLDRDYNIAVRAGLHCAASAHRALGTHTDGLVRVSFGASNRDSDVERLCQALSNLIRSTEPVKG